jgi:hypothetical protein
MMRKKPMLAYPAGDKPIDYSKPIFIQPKLDGVRCLIQREANYMPGAISLIREVLLYLHTQEQVRSGRI